MSISIRYCRSCSSENATRCATHPLNWGYMKQMTRAALYGSGLTWGGMVDEEEAERQARMSIADKAALDAKKAAADKAHLDAVAAAKKAADEAKTTQRLRDYANGEVAKSKGARRCKGECYDGGCDVRRAHKNACSFIHADELEKYVGIFAGFGIKMVDDAEFLALVKLCDKTEDTIQRNTMKRDIKTLDEGLKMQMKGRWLWVTGVDAEGEMKFSKTNPEPPQRERPNRPMLHAQRPQQQQQRMQQQQPMQKTHMQSVTTWRSNEADNGAW